MGERAHGCVASCEEWPGEYGGSGYECSRFDAWGYRRRSTTAGARGARGRRPKMESYTCDGQSSLGRAQGSNEEDPGILHRTSTIKTPTPTAKPRDEPENHNPNPLSQLHDPRQHPGRLRRPRPPPNARTAHTRIQTPLRRRQHRLLPALTIQTPMPMSMPIPDQEARHQDLHRRLRRARCQGRRCAPHRRRPHLLFQGRQ